MFPRLEEALASGTLGWTKVRLLASLPRGEDEAGWIARATRLTAEQLSKRVRAVDRGSVEAGLADDDEAPDRSRVFEVRCSPDVRWKWYAARGAASRAAGRMLHVAEAAELIAAEVLSAVPVDEHWDQEDCDEAALRGVAEEDGGHGRARDRRDGIGERARRGHGRRGPRVSVARRTAHSNRSSSGSNRPTPSSSTTASGAPFPWNSVWMPASDRCSPGSGTAGCIGRWATRPARPTRASASAWIPHAPGPSCASSARPR